MHDYDSLICSTEQDIVKVNNGGFQQWQSDEILMEELHIKPKLSMFWACFVHYLSKLSTLFFFETNCLRN